MIKHVVTDIDGTLLDLDNTFDASLPQLVAELQARGVCFHMCTNRSFDDTIGLYDALGYDGTMILEDGCILYQNGQLFQRGNIDVARTSFRASQLIAESFGYATHINDTKQAIVSIHVGEKGDPRREAKVVNATQLLEEKLASNDISVYNTGRGNIIIKPKGITKAEAIRTCFGDVPQSVLFIGDGINDIEALEYVHGAKGFTGSPQNATADVKQKTQFVAQQPYSLGAIEVMRFFT